MRIDPGVSGTGALLITDLGNGLVQVSDTANLFFDFSLDDGINFMLEDPTLILEAFDAAPANPLISTFSTTYRSQRRLPAWATRLQV